MRRLPAPAVVNPEVGGPSSALPPHRQVLSSILHVKLRYISFKWQQDLRKSLSQVCTVGGYQKTSNHCGWVLTTASQPGLVKLCRQHPVSLSRSASYRLDISGNRGSFSGPYVSPREDRWFPWISMDLPLLVVSNALSDPPMRPSSQPIIPSMVEKHWTTINIYSNPPTRLPCSPLDSPWNLRSLPARPAPLATVATSAFWVLFLAGDGPIALDHFRWEMRVVQK